MEKTFLTPAFGLVTIPVSFMAPQETPRGIVQIVHGMCEHKERYFPLMEFLAANGYARASGKVGVCVAPRPYRPRGGRGLAG